MPELPEVEQFRRLLQTLVSDKCCLKLQRHSLDKNPPRNFLSDDDIETINDGNYFVVEARRRGKQLCLNLQPKKKKQNQKSGNNDNCDKDNNHDQTKFLFIHMGMTGSISTPTYSPKLQEVKFSTEFPPPYTYLQFSVGTQHACFADPRKFGSILLKDSDIDLHDLAPDAWTDLDFALTLSNNAEDDFDIDRVSCPITADVVQKLTGKSLGIKSLLLDQKRAVCGVGNWVADEVLYQCEMHPDQNYLSTEQSYMLLSKLHHILDVAISCLHTGEEFPQDWLFHYRWSNKGNGSTSKDYKGRTISFVTSGGRTSAIVPSLQKNKAPGRHQRQQQKSSSAKKSTDGKRKKVADLDDLLDDGSGETGKIEVVSKKTKKGSLKIENMKPKQDTKSNGTSGASSRPRRVKRA